MLELVKFPQTNTVEELRNAVEKQLNTLIRAINTNKLGRDLDAAFYGIRNVASPTNPKDVVTVEYLERILGKQKQTPQRSSSTSTTTVSGANSLTFAPSSATTGLTNVNQIICTLEIPTTGTYLCIGIFDFRVIGTGDADQFIIGELLVNGVAETDQALFQANPTASIDFTATVAQQWLIEATAGDELTLEARKNAGSGSSVFGPNSNLSALLVS